MKKKLLIRIRIILTFCLIFSIFFGFQVFAQNNSVTVDIDNFINNSFFEGNFSLNTKLSNTDELIKNFCYNIGVLDKSFTNGTYYYNPNQSAFISLLCGNFKENGLKYEYFKKTKFYDLVNIGKKNDCTSLSLNKCRLDQHLPDIFDKILNDYFNIRQAKIYGLTSPDFGKNPLDEQVNNFVKNKIIIPDANIPDKIEIKYICGDETDFPDTCKAVKKYTQKANKLLAKLDVINFEKIADTECTTTNESNIFLCGLTSENMGYFKNMVLNEMLYYRLFVGYYVRQVNQSYQLLPEGSITFKKDYKEKIVKNFNNRVLQTKKATTTSIRMLDDMNMSYPIHIGFLLYQEKLIEFRKNLAKIYTPVLTLYDKLQNVQSQ